MRHQKNRRKLRNLFISSIQFKLAFANLVYILLVIGVVVLSVLSPFYADMYGSSSLYDQHLAANIFIVLIERSFVALLAILIFSFIHQVIISHRFCGPLVNFNKTFEKISHGDLTRKVFLRRHDFLKNEAAQVNEMIDSLTSFVRKAKENHDRLYEILEKLEGSRTTQEIFDESLKTAKHQVKLGTEHLSKMKTGNTK